MVDDDDIEDLRARIGELDSAVIRLLGERFELVRLLGRAKARAGVAIENPEREAELRALHVAAARSQGLEPEMVRRLFEVVLEQSKAEQRAQGRRPKTA